MIHHHHQWLHTQWSFYIANLIVHSFFFLNISVRPTVFVVKYFPVFGRVRPTKFGVFQKYFPGDLFRRFREIPCDLTLRVFLKFENLVEKTFRRAVATFMKKSTFGKIKFTDGATVVWFFDGILKLKIVDFIVVFRRKTTGNDDRDWSVVFSRARFLQKTDPIWETKKVASSFLNVVVGTWSHLST